MAVEVGRGVTSVRLEVDVVPHLVQADRDGLSIVGAVRPGLSDDLATLGELQTLNLGEDERGDEGCTGESELESVDTSREEGNHRTVDVRCDFQHLVVVSRAVEILEHSLLDDRPSVDVDDRLHEQLLSEEVEEGLSEPRRCRRERRPRELSLEESDCDLLVCTRRTSQNQGGQPATRRRWGRNSPGSTRQRRLKATTLFELCALTAVAIAVSSEESRAARGWGAGTDATMGVGFGVRRTCGTGAGASMVVLILYS